MLRPGSHGRCVEAAAPGPGELFRAGSPTRPRCPLPLQRPWGASCPGGSIPIPGSAAPPRLQQIVWALGSRSAQPWFSRGPLILCSTVPWSPCDFQPLCALGSLAVPPPAPTVRRHSQTGSAPGLWPTPPASSCPPRTHSGDALCLHRLPIPGLPSLSTPSLLAVI